MKKIGIIRHYNAPKVSGETDMGRGISELKLEDLKKFKQLMDKYGFFVENSEGFENLPILIGSGMYRSIQSLTIPIERLYGADQVTQIMTFDQIAVYATNTIDQNIDGVDKGFGVREDIISHIAKQIYTGEKSFFNKNSLPLNLTEGTLNATLGYFSKLDFLFNYEKDNFLSATHGPTNDLHKMIVLESALREDPKNAKKMLEFIAENGATKTGEEVCSYEKTSSGIYLFDPIGNNVKTDEIKFRKLAIQYNHQAHLQHKISSEVPYK